MYVIAGNASMWPRVFISVMYYHKICETSVTISLCFFSLFSVEISSVYILRLGQKLKEEKKVYVRCSGQTPLEGRESSIEEDKLYSLHSIHITC